MLSPRDWKVINALVIVLLWIFFGTFIFWYLESSWTWIDSFYFAVSTLTTVGYGDITPSSQFSRLVAALYILFGVGIVLASLTLIGGEFLKREEIKLRRTYKKQNDKKEEEVSSEIEGVKKILRRNTKELKEQAEYIEITSQKNQKLRQKVKELKEEEKELEKEVHKRKKSSKK